jgi:hypothetical protein
LIGEFSAVDLVENLHENKSLKDNCVDDSFVCCDCCFTLGILLVERSV